MFIDDHPASVRTRIPVLSFLCVDLRTPLTRLSGEPAITVSISANIHNYHFQTLIFGVGLWL